MNILKWGILVFFSLVVLSCSRSKPPKHFILSPLPAKNSQAVKKYPQLRIGLDKVNIPEYIERKQLTIHLTTHRVDVEEEFHWAESLESNITRVLKTNLSTLLPGAVVESSPWTSKFRPTHQVKVNITEYAVNKDGLSILRAEYLIFKANKLISKQMHYYKNNIQEVNPDTLVQSMNTHLTRLSYDLAKVFKHQRHG